VYILMRILQPFGQVIIAPTKVMIAKQH
jgi:hypothetical protein